MIDKTQVFLNESNAIEGVYDDDSLQQAKYAWKYLKTQGSLTTSAILKAHKILMLHQPLRPSEKGYWRKIYVQVGKRMCPDPHQVPSLIADWVKSANEIVNEEVIKYSHINFEKIHPFVDGNGRIGRILMNWQRLKNKLPLLIIFENEKQIYYKWFE